MNNDQFIGFGESSGMGGTPAIIVIDFMNAFTDPNSKLGSNLDKEIQSTKKVLEVARTKEVPIIFTTVAYEPHYEDGAHFIKKIPALKALTIGSQASAIDVRLKRRKDTEVLLTKKFASAFFGTNLPSLLINNKIDTLILVGCSTSGCVRATAVDGLQYGYQVVVAEDCVGDRSENAHQANLYDIQTKYGDVVRSKEVIDYIKSLKGERENVQSRR